MGVQLRSFHKNINYNSKINLPSILFSIELYKVIILVLVVLSSNPLLYEISYILKFTHIWSLGILIYDLFHDRFIYKDKYFIYKLAFAFFYVITMIINFKNLTFGNISESMYFVVSLLILTSNGHYSFAGLKKEIVRISKIYLILVTPLNLISIFLYLQNKSYAILINGSPRFIGMYEHHGRLSGFFGNPVDLAFFSLIGIFCSFIMVRWYQCNKKMQSIYVISLLVNLATLLFSNTRTHFFTLILIIVIYTLRSNNGMIGKIKILFNKYKYYLIISIVGLFFLLLNTSLLQNIRYFNFSLNGRLELWVLGMQVIAYSPLFGVGFGNFGVMVSQLGLTTATVIGGGVHQGLLELLVHTGIMGTTALLILIYKTIQLQFNNERIKSDQVLSTVWYLLISLLITSVADSTITFPLYITNVIFFISIGYLTGAEGSKV